MITTYEEAISAIYNLERSKVFDLHKTKQWIDLLWNPLKNIKIIHIAWTNWKWSVSKMTFSVLKNVWKKVWVYTSPHLIDIRERFQTDIWYITKKEFIFLANKILELPIKLSQFERQTLIFFEFLKLRWVEYWVVEVWLWWRLDSTNIVNPIITCITSISYDHMDTLWDTLEKISYEKAWIIKNWIPIVINHINKVIEDTAKERKAPVIFSQKKIKTNMLWDYQERNAWLAFEVCKYLWFDDKIILEWLQKVEHIWRLQYVNKNLLIDWAHNEWWLKELKKYIDSIKINYKKINYCFSLRKWKNINIILDILWI